MCLSLGLKGEQVPMAESSRISIVCLAFAEALKVPDGYNLRPVLREITGWVVRKPQAVSTRVKYTWASCRNS